MSLYERAWWAQLKPQEVAQRQYKSLQGRRNTPPSTKTTTTEMLGPGCHDNLKPILPKEIPLGERKRDLAVSFFLFSLFFFFLIFPPDAKRWY